MKIDSVELEKRIIKFRNEIRRKRIKTSSNTNIYYEYTAEIAILKAVLDIIKDIKEWQSIKN